MDKINKPFCIGLTGGIGSGKTTAANFFADLDVPIIDADIIAREVILPNTKAYDAIIDKFSDAILHADGNINRQALREHIFHHAQDKKWLENLLHPLIRQTMRTQISTVTAAYCICVIPLLAESSGIDFINRVLVIETPKDMQKKRVMQRDKSHQHTVEAIIQSQANTRKRRAIADDIIINNGSLTSLKSQVHKLHQHYLSLSHSP